MEKKIMAPVHPGEILMKEFLEPLGITQYRLIRDAVSSVDRSAIRQQNECMKTHALIDQRSLAMMRAVIDKIENDHRRTGLEKARSTCERWLRMHDNPYLKHWQEILRGDWTGIKKILLDESEEATALRQCNPFCGILSSRERWKIYRDFRSL
jgi:hypothetical protein